MMCRQ